MADFKPFAAAVAAQFALMSKHELYTTGIDHGDLCQMYLNSFPEGTNPIYRENTKHHCTCCFNFIKNLGNVVAFNNGTLMTVWDVKGLEAPYDIVAATMSALVKSLAITGIFRSEESGYGAISNKELMDDGKVRTWNHFYGTVAARHKSNTPGKDRGDFNTTVEVFTRGLKELKASALTQVLELIEENQLYRGEEHKAAVMGFLALHLAYNQLGNDADWEQFIWLNAVNKYARFRNTSIGTLVIDLSSGVDTELAIKAFEKIMAPENYKRPTSLVTPKMKEQALASIVALGLEEALERRFACIADITINNVLWADNSVKPMMKSALASVMDSIPVVQKDITKKQEDISIADFLANVLPQAKSIDMVVKNRHLGNFMSVITGVHPSNGELFKWDNNFSLTYTGNIADSIKERVKAAGGATDAVLRVSLAWHNGDDLDLHAYEPQGEHIYFGNRGCKTRINKGSLDVDMNAGSAKNSKDPVENIVWATPSDGAYTINVNNYTLRSKSNVGYTLEVENNGAVHQYTCMQSPTQGSTHMSLVLTVKNRVVTSIKAMKELTGGSFSQVKWGVSTEQAVKVNTIMLSPNYWDGNATGNKHYVFILEGCKADEPLRGILNEYLHPSLEQHRKVFEVLGEKTKCQPTQSQLSGLGFSSTKGDSVLVNVAGDKGQRAYNIIF